MNEDSLMRRLRDNYDVIAVVILIAALAFVPDTLDNSFRYVSYEQPTVIIAK